MDEDEKERLGSNQQEEGQQPSIPDTSQITDQGKKVGKKALSTIRGFAGGATETGEAAAGAEAGAATAGAAAGEASAAASVAAEAGAATTAELGAEAVGASAATAGSGFGGWAVVAVVLIIVGITIFVALFGNAQTTTGTENTSPPIVAPPCDQIDSGLASLNLNAQAMTNCERKQLLYTTIATLLSYSQFKTLIGTSPITFVSADDGSLCSGDPAFWGCTKSGSKVWLKNFDDPNDKTPWQYVITHEMFHVFAIRNNAIQTKYFGLNGSFIQSEPSCYRINSTSRVIKTYDLDTTRVGESFAESGALYVLGGRKSITNLASQCPKNYGFWLQTIGQPSSANNGGSNSSGQLVTFTIGKHTVTTNYRSSNNCGAYDLANTSRYPIGNFGNPNCDFSKDAAINLIKSLDSGWFYAKNGKRYDRVDVWIGIIQCESGFSPNAINKNSRSGWGAWGLFQMNPDFSGRAVHDNGTTDWRTQISNAITRNNNTGGGFGYWGCSRGFRKGTK